MTQLSIPESIQYGSATYKVTTIGNYAFSQCSHLSGSLTIPESVTSIGSRAFEGCSGFTGSLTIPYGVTSIGGAAFRYCSGFNGSLTIPESVITIGTNAFQGCSGFTGSLIIPDSVTTMGSQAFSGCSGFNGSLTIGNSVEKLESFVFTGCNGFTGTLTIGNSIQSIPANYFSDFSGFSSLIIGNSVKTIGNSAFSGCTGLTGTLTIPEGVTSIGTLAFYKCSGLTGELKFPESVIEIGMSAFEGCSGFTGSLTIPVGVTSIQYNTFRECSGFTGPLTIPESVTEIGSYAFYGCSGLTGSLTIPDAVQTIGDNAFYSCSGFTGSLTIGENVQSIGERAFYDCRKFTGSLTIPESVTSIGNYAFLYCYGFDAVMTSLNPIPPTCQSLPGYVTTVYVPNGSKEAYQQANYWKNYTILELAGELEGTLKVEDFAINAGETKDVNVSFTGDLNGNTYAGFQFNLSMPQGLTITDASLSEQLAAAGFSLRTSTTGTDKILIISANTSGKSSEITDNLVTVTVAAAPDAPHGQSQISLTNASFSSLLGSDLILTESKSTVTINNVPVTGFTVTPEEEQNIYVGQQCTLEAEVVPADATNKNFTWSVQNIDDGYVSVEKNENGQITVKGLKLGKAVLQLTASDYKGFSTTVNVNVVPTPASSVEISDEDLILLEGTTWQLSATVLPEDTTDKTITWSSESDDIATVTQGGLVTAVKEGETTVKATCGEAVGTCTVVVKALQDITVTPGEGAADGDEDDNPGENTQDGLAILGDNLILRVGQTGTVNLDIQPALNYDPALVWALGTDGENYVQMTVGTDNTVSATFKGLAVGETTYTVSTPADNAVILTGSVKVIAENPVMSLSVSPNEVSLAKNALSFHLTATISPETVTTATLLWESSDQTVATVDPQGNVSPVAMGECDITVRTTDGTDLSAVCHVTVTEPIDDNFDFDFDDDVMQGAEGIEIYLGATYQFTPKAQDGYVLPDEISWTSSEPATVSVTNAGLITGLELGSATVTASAMVNNQEVKAECLVTVIPVPARSISIDGGGVESIKCKETLTLTATVLPSNTTYPEVTWQSSSDENAIVSQKGVVTGQKPGMVTITAFVTEYPDVKATYELEITDILLGDSNDNGFVTVADVVTTANHIISMPVAAWSFVNADVTQDNTISSADVTGTVDIILKDFEDGLKLFARAMVPRLLSDRLVSDNFIGGKTEARINVSLENSVPYSAMQATVAIPDGMTVKGVEAGPRLSDHMLLFNVTDEGLLKVVIFSFSNSEFEDSDQPLFTIVANTANALGDLLIYDIFGSDARSNEYELGFAGGQNDNFTTGLEAVNGADVVIRVVADGIEVLNATERAITVYRYTGETVANVKAAAPVEHISLESGMYIVKCASTSAKVLVK
ncbi:MAG: leucine-rich repeat protein [Muribaculaceae bacterium]|nr:leucine-rich repeat protein [Muribaculaceae bacterium]